MWSRRNHGQGLVEYALLLALVALVAVVILAALGDKVSETFNCLVTELQSASGTNGPFTGFILVDAGTDTDIQALPCGGTLVLADLPTSNLNIRANVRKAAGSATLQLDGPTTQSRTEENVPYAVFSDTGGNYASGSLDPGDYTLTATAYAGNGASGEELGSMTITFHVE